ncbi:MAG: DUF2975 domain-containing protein [Xanthomonadales bacterium]|jgi:hypothetical protein|nr:DUF2975 domain-containing protein [Xanthomonadales bacterium]
MSERYARHCRRLRVATALVGVGIATLVLFGLVGPPIPIRVEAAGLSPAQWTAVRLIVALPACGYLWALWAAQQALGQLAAGQRFQPTVSRALRQIAGGMLFGALAEVVLLTNLLRLVLDGSGSYLYVDLSAIVLGVVGAALIPVARLVDQARALQHELDEII